MLILINKSSDLLNATASTMPNPHRENPSFFKVMIGDFHSTLRIPPVFKQNLGANFQGKSVLRSPGGQHWYVKIVSENGDFLFGDGWRDFVLDHSISMGDFLVFAYDGNLGFDVKVYGTTGCERVGSGGPTGIRKPGIAKEDQCKASKVKTESKKPRTVRERSEFCHKVLSGRRGKVEDTMALQVACSFECRNPHFVATCRRTRSTYMTIPMTLVDKYALAGKEILVVRDPTGISWPVKLSQWCSGRLCLSTGWSDFYRGNCLKEGDVCVFEFTEEGKEIIVHIFRGEGSIAESAQKSGKPIQRSKKDLTNKERVLKAANSFKTSYPKFISLWRQSCYYCMPIPVMLVKELGLKKNQDAILHDPCGRTWPVKLTFRSKGRLDLGIGWSNFVRENHLSVGDACLFEFIQGADAIKVHIFRGEINTSI